MNIKNILIITIIIFGVSIFAENLTAQTQTAPKPCLNSEKTKEFDFWLGDWDVLVNGKKVGENFVEKKLDGCTLVEKWKANSGGTGMSLNSFNPATQKWKQFYVGSGGSTLEFEGVLEKNVMRMEGSSIGQNGKIILHKLDFHLLPDETVRQHWQQSYDKGNKWTTVWDSIYVKKKHEAKKASSN